MLQTVRSYGAVSIIHFCFLPKGRPSGDVRVVRLYGKSEMGEHIGSPLQIPIYLRTFAEYFNVI